MGYIGYTRGDRWLVGESLTKLCTKIRLGKGRRTIVSFFSVVIRLNIEMSMSTSFTLTNCAYDILSAAELDMHHVATMMLVLKVFKDLFFLLTTTSKQQQCCILLSAYYTAKRVTERCEKKTWL